MGASSAATALLSSVCSLWHHPMALRKPLQSLQNRYRTPRRSPGHPGATTSQLLLRSLFHHHQPLLAGNQPRKKDTWMTYHFRTAQSETSSSLSVTRSWMATFTELQRWPFLEALFPGKPHRGQRALRELSMSRNTELKRLQQREVGEVSRSTAHWAANQGKDAMRPQAAELRGKRASALTAWGSISKAMERARWREQQRERQHTESSGRGKHPTDVQRPQAASAAWSGGRYKAARNAMRDQERSKTGIMSNWHP